MNFVDFSSLYFLSGCHGNIHRGKKLCEPFLLVGDAIIRLLKLTVFRVG